MMANRESSDRDNKRELERLRREQDMPGTRQYEEYTGKPSRPLDAWQSPWQQNVEPAPSWQQAEGAQPQLPSHHGSHSSRSHRSEGHKSHNHRSEGRTPRSPRPKKRETKHVSILVPGWKVPHIRRPEESESSRRASSTRSSRSSRSHHSSISGRHSTASSRSDESKRSQNSRPDVREQRSQNPGNLYNPGMLRVPPQQQRHSEQLSPRRLEGENQKGSSTGTSRSSSSPRRRPDKDKVVYQESYAESEGSGVSRKDFASTQQHPPRSKQRSKHSSTTGSSKSGTSVYEDAESYISQSSRLSHGSHKSRISNTAWRPPPSSIITHRQYKPSSRADTVVPDDSISVAPDDSITQIGQEEPVLTTDELWKAIREVNKLKAPGMGSRAPGSKHEAPRAKAPSSVNTGSLPDTSDQRSRAPSTAKTRSSYRTADILQVEPQVGSIKGPGSNTSRSSSRTSQGIDHGDLFQTPVATHPPQTVSVLPQVDEEAEGSDSSGTHASSCECSSCEGSVNGEPRQDVQWVPAPEQQGYEQYDPQYVSQNPSLDGDQQYMQPDQYGQPVNFQQQPVHGQYAQPDMQQGQQYPPYFPASNGSQYGQEPQYQPTFENQQQYAPQQSQYGQSPYRAQGQAPNWPQQ